MIFLNKEFGAIIELLKKQNVFYVLDLACGSGRFSVPLLKIGAKVKGVDLVRPSLTDKNFSFIKKDVRDFNFKRKYDLIIASLFLHFFYKDKSIKLINKMKKSVFEEGLNFLVCMSDKDDLAKIDKSKFYPSLEDLKEIYNGWEVLFEKQGETPLENHDNISPINII